MSVANKKDLLNHVEHEVVVVYYGDATNPASVCVECVTCGEVLYCEEDNDKKAYACESCSLVKADVKWREDSEQYECLECYADWDNQ